jgi:hypothetical protein
MCDGKEIADRTEELEAFYSETFPPKVVKLRSHVVSPPLTDDEVILNICGTPYFDKFLRLMGGDLSDYGGDHSAADLALLGMLAYWTQDWDQLDRLFRQSKLYRSKWERADYRERTIAKALEREEVYLGDARFEQSEEPETDAERGSSEDEQPEDPDAQAETNSEDVPSEIAGTQTENGSSEKEQSEEPKAKKPRFEIHTVEEVLQLPNPEWLIDKLLVRGTVAEAVGPRASLKSFIAGDIANHVALGWAWCGHNVIQGPVLYIAGEGFAGQKQRLQAWMQKFEVTDIPGLEMLGSSVDFSDLKTVEELFLTIVDRKVPYQLVIIDTLARNKGKAQENSNDDMQAVLTGMETIARDLGACVFVIHHIARSTGSDRGATSFGDGVQTIIKVTRDENLVTLTVEKQKDGPELPPFGLEAEVVLLPSGASSLVLVPTDTLATPKARQERMKNDLKSHEQILAFMKLKERIVPLSRAEWESISGLSRRKFEEARDALIAARMVIEEKQGRTMMYRAREADE